ncbi:MAG: rod shape-determining protein MreC [Betaproteobacteria bacterium]|nr:rod shape-determining protein MreC [Betaproteobacteria bacterium]
MEHQPPPFFKTGPTPLARLLIFSALSLAFLVADARFNYLLTLRQVAAVVVYPFQRIATAPASIARRIGEFFVTHGSLREDNARLARENFENATRLQQLEALRAENAQLRELLAIRGRIGVELAAAEVLYASRDPFTRKVIVDRGSRHQVLPGQAVIDNRGVVGQVTRVYPWLAEVTLVTDKGQFIPVQNLRNGLRAVLAGTGNDGALELRFIPLNADYQNGDRLVTSGIDGVYPPGLPVAQVMHVERSAAQIFARITCAPLGGVSNHAQVLIVRGARELPPRPVEEPKSPRARKSRKG